MNALVVNAIKDLEFFSEPGIKTGFIQNSTQPTPAIFPGERPYTFTIDTATLRKNSVSHTSSRLVLEDRICARLSICNHLQS